MQALRPHQQSEETTADGHRSQLMGVRRILIPHCLTNAGGTEEVTQDHRRHNANKTVDGLGRYSPRRVRRLLMHSRSEMELPAATYAQANSLFGINAID
jgi:hypothetical protein